jgi:hypothetical protein
LSWYMGLANTKICRWEDLVNAFVKKYKYNMDIAPDRTSLSNLEKKGQEKHKAVYLKVERSSCTNVSPTFRQKNDHYIC